MVKRTHEQLRVKAMSKPAVQKAYDSLKEEFQLFEMMIEARLKAGKTQEEIAKEMATTTSAVGRLETGGGSLQHSPSINTLRKYAKAVGCNLQIKFVRPRVN